MKSNVITMKDIIDLPTDCGRCYLFGSTDFYFRYVIPVNSATGYSAKSIEDARINAVRNINANTTALRWFKRSELASLGDLEQYDQESK